MRDAVDLAIEKLYADKTLLRAEFAILRAEVEAKEEELTTASCAIDAFLRRLGKADAEIAQLRADNARLLEALMIVAGKRQGIDNLMSDKEIALAAIARTTEGK